MSRMHIALVACCGRTYAMASETAYYTESDFRRDNLSYAEGAAYEIREIDLTNPKTTLPPTICGDCPRPRILGKILFPEQCSRAASEEKP